MMMKLHRRHAAHITGSSIRVDDNIVDQDDDDHDDFDDNDDDDSDDFDDNVDLDDYFFRKMTVMAIMVIIIMITLCLVSQTSDVTSDFMMMITMSLVRVRIFSISSS